MHTHFNDPDQYLVCILCKVHQNISNYRFKHFTCGECVYLRRYGFRHKKGRFLERAKKYNIEVKP